MQSLIRLVRFYNLNKCNQYYQRILIESISFFTKYLLTNITQQSIYQMSVKGDQKTFRVNNYDIIVSPISEKKLAIQIIDSILKIEFAQQELTLEKIGVSTLILALEGRRKEVSMTTTYKKQGEFEILQLKITVESLFLKNIEEVIYIKKLRDVEEMEILQKKIKSLSLKMKDVKQSNANTGVTFYSVDLNQKTFNSAASYDALHSINLKKGRYLLTFSFNLKATSQWIYMYLNQGENIMSNSGYYVPTTSQFLPFTIRTLYTVNESEKQVSFTTTSASSYPVILQNRIITAQRLSD